MVVLTAVAFVALIAFAQDIKTAISKTSGLQRSEYIETDKGKLKVILLAMFVLVLLSVRM